MIGFILNIPYTIIGLVVGLISLPTKISFIFNSPYAIVLNIKKFWWTFSYAKNARGAAIGHVVLLGPNVEDKDLEHELLHIEQHRRIPLIFPFFYFYQIFRYGYKKNKYEVEAYTKAGNICRLGNKKVVFICNGNILRSQIAKAIYNKLAKDGSVAYSYGTRVEAKGRQGVLISSVKGMNITIDELLKQGIDISNESCDQLKEEYLQNVDKIIVTADREYIPNWLNNYKYEYWEIINPDYFGREIAVDIIESIKEKVLELIK